MVSTPRDGGQSRRITSYSSATGASARASTCSRPVRVSRCTSEPARSMVAGRMSSPSTLRHHATRVGGLHLAHEHVMDRLVQIVGVDADGEGETRLGVEVDEQHTPPHLRQREAEGVDRRRLGDATFLVGHRHDPRHGGSLRPVSRAAAAPAARLSCADASSLVGGSTSLASSDRSRRSSSTLSAENDSGGSPSTLRTRASTSTPLGDRATIFTRRSVGCDRRSANPADSSPSTSDVT